MRRLWCALAVLCALGAVSVRAEAPAKNPGAFPFHDGDRVVFLGDSITEQRLYTTYIETYLLTRFPTWNLQFRNAGWGQWAPIFASVRMPSTPARRGT